MGDTYLKKKAYNMLSKWRREGLSKDQLIYNTMLTFGFGRRFVNDFITITEELEIKGGNPHTKKENDK